MADAATTRIGFLGAGKMATALARAWLTSGLVNREGITASDPEPAARASFEKETGIAATTDNKSVATRSDVLILAVKPQNMAGLLTEIQPVATSRHLVISIAAGITLARLATELTQCRLIRVMPNTPCLVSASASAFAPGPTAMPQDIELVHRLLKAVGLAYQLPEKLLDAVTGLSGSGPAYIFVLIEALSDGGVRMGLPRDVAVALSAQTVLGSAKLLLETGLHPATLKDMVASPGGTTIAGLQALERGGFRAALIDAVEAATLRSAELGDN